VKTYEVVIGLEVHVQLAVQSKLFCSCSAEGDGDAPNTRVCPICLGLPGVLPFLNEHALHLAVRAARLLGCTINPASQFARKHYFYPDLPKGYQVSQDHAPLGEHGQLHVPSLDVPVRIARIHMEEDAGKSTHVGAESRVDLNRAGVPLVEIVSEPVLRSAEDAAHYLRSLHELMVFAGVTSGDMERGNFRADANVSLRERGASEFGTRVELKNINSFRFIEKAIAYEVGRQKAILESGANVLRETRGFDSDKGTTYSMRSKEEAHDYRFLAEPDLPPAYVPQSWMR
jgi:aspartyl-tRNA(Asn)/glutamyl-tRNA(Gln) amidotransferase subunit B